MYEEIKNKLNINYINKYRHLVISNILTIKYFNKVAIANHLIVLLKFSLYRSYSNAHPGVFQQRLLFSW